MLYHVQWEIEHFESFNDDLKNFHYVKQLEEALTGDGVM